jgi:hypothetical protein
MFGGAASDERDDIMAGTDELIDEIDIDLGGDDDSGNDDGGDDDLEGI